MTLFLSFFGFFTFLFGHTFRHITLFLKVLPVNWRLDDWMLTHAILRHLIVKHDVVLDLILSLLESERILQIKWLEVLKSVRLNTVWWTLFDSRLPWSLILVYLIFPNFFNVRDCFENWSARHTQTVVSETLDLSRQICHDLLVLVREMLLLIIKRTLELIRLLI